jgi:hypothetical protein
VVVGGGGGGPGASGGAGVGAGAGVGSGSTGAVEDATDALLARSLPSPVYDGSSRTTNVNDCDAPGAIDAMAGQATAAMQPDADDTNVSGLGSVSETTTLLATDGPLFVTATV